MKELTIIVPLNVYDDEVKGQLKAAIESAEATNVRNESKIMFIGPKNVVDAVKNDYKEKNYLYVENETPDFCTQINKAAKEVKTGYFSILEFDDAYTRIWIDNVEKYLKAYEDLSLILPLTEVYDYKEKGNGPIGYTNEAVWASSFSDEIGYLDLECVKNYMNFNTTGGIFKKKDFIEVGGLKESMKLSYWYEYLLRALYNKKKIYVIPKVGYNHIVNRPNSVADTYNKTMTKDEADFWVETALKEYIYKTDRKKAYKE